MGEEREEKIEGGQRNDNENGREKKGGKRSSKESEEGGGEGEGGGGKIVICIGYLLTQLAGIHAVLLILYPHRSPTAVHLRR